jgi:hypothetical protein
MTFDVSFKDKYCMHNCTICSYSMLFITKFVIMVPHKLCKTSDRRNE